MRVKMKVTPLYRRVTKLWDEYKILVLQGGSRSSKTYTLAQKHINELIKPENAGRGDVLTIVRKTFPSLRASIMRDFFEILTDMGLYEPRFHNRTENTYKLEGNLVEFLSMDSPQKKRGTKRRWLWVNEANELEYEDFFQLSIRTEEKITLDYNPSDEFHWIYDKVIPREDAGFDRSTYKDNTFLVENIVKEIERLKDVDPEYWKIYGLGEKGISKATIYDNWDIVSSMPKEANHRRYGVDFGYNHPSVVLEMAIIENDVWIDEIVYETRLTNSQLIDRMRQAGVDKNVLMRADSAEPDRIQEISDAGYMIEGAKKGAGSVRDGIDNIKRCRLHITKRSVNTTKEIKNYKWRENPKTGEVMDEPVAFKDDAMAAKRYAIGDIIFDADIFQPRKVEKVTVTVAERFWERVEKDKKKYMPEKEESLEEGYVAV